MNQARARVAEVDDQGIYATAAEDAAVDVLFDAQRVWSFRPGRDGVRERDGYRVQWPAPLRPYLVGTGRVVVGEHGAEAAYFDGEVTFGGSQEPLSVRDRGGNPLSVMKTGKLQSTYAVRDDDAIDAVVDTARRALEFVREQTDFVAFLAFGGLLGAVRGGKLIGHDNDLDIAVMFPHGTPVDANLQSYRLERRFRAAGWRTLRFSAAAFKVARPVGEGSRPFVDVFGGFEAAGRWYLMPNVSAPVEALRLEPLSEVTLEGRSFPAPRDPEQLLEITYGPGWKVPDPAFAFEVPGATRRRLRMWTRNANANRDHWFGFYKGPGGDKVPLEPSAFARWFADQSPDGPVMDIGCGTGRDSLWLSAQGHQVLGMDYAPGAVSRARSEAAARGLDANFQTLNLIDRRQVLGIGGQMSHEPGPRQVYGRFLVHALTDEGRAGLWRLSSMSLRRGGKLWLEFRARSTERVTYEFGAHFRQELPAAQVAAEIESCGGRIEQLEQGHGFAVYKEEDPYVCRMVASWS